MDELVILLRFFLASLRDREKYTKHIQTYEEYNNQTPIFYYSELETIHIFHNFCQYFLKK